MTAEAFQVASILADMRLLGVEKRGDVVEIWALAAEVTSAREKSARSIIMWLNMDVSVMICSSLMMKGGILFVPV